jgi:TRAP-type C4-dicarboxylate transport system substrate-binding protein
MNKDSFARLPEKAQAAIDAHSGRALSLRMGKAADETNVEGKAKFVAMPGHSVAALRPAELARWKQALAPISEDWMKTVPDGAAVLAAFRTELAKARGAM